MSAPTLPALLRATAARLGPRPALRYKHRGIWHVVSWTGYLERVRAFGLGLLDLGLGPEDRVAVLAENCPEWLYADLGTQAVGGITVGLYPTSPAAQLRYILEHSGARFVVAGDQEQTDKVLAIAETLPALERILVVDWKGMRHYRDARLLAFEDVLAAGRARAAAEPERADKAIDQLDPGSAAIIVYTSGTTGPAKGALLSHANILTMVDAMMAVAPVTEADSLVSYLPLCHVAERLFSVFVPLRSGCVANFAESLATVQANVQEIAPTVFFGVPRIWEKMLAQIQIRIADTTPAKRLLHRVFWALGRRAARLDAAGGPGRRAAPLLRAIAYSGVFRAQLNQLGLRRARLCISGGAPIAPEVLEFFRTMGLRIREAYGMTESAGLAFLNPADRIKIGSVGLPAPHTEVRIAEDGEILLRSPSVFLGYYGDPAATAQITAGGWLHTGDVGRLDADGYLYVTDRKKDLIITAGGKNVAPQEIENKLKFSPYVRETVVVGDRRPYVVALVQIDPETVGKWALDRGIPFTTFRDLATKREVRDLIAQAVEAVNRELSPPEQVKRFALLEKELDHDDGELTATLKVRRAAVEARFRAEIEGLYR
ncbi:MAG: AMP-binding protein [Candidatus Rokubacteria bacterium]|nr:AMP-binding protein [Candidatus Rokubacteria bacterium]